MSIFLLGLVILKENRPRTRLVPTGSNLRSPRRRTLSFPTDHTLQVNLEEEQPHTHTVDGRRIVAYTILHLLLISRSSLACVTLKSGGHQARAPRGPTGDPGVRSRSFQMESNGLRHYLRTTRGKFPSHADREKPLFVIFAARFREIWDRRSRSEFRSSYGSAYSRRTRGRSHELTMFVVLLSHSCLV